MPKGIFMLQRVCWLMGSVLILAGCMEGQKTAPLQRAGSSKPASEVAEKPQPPEKSPAEPPAKPSLYERLGKEPAIVKVVDDFVANVAADPDIKDKHKKHFQEGDVAGLKKKLVDQVGQATGGPQKYLGKNMKDAHKGLEITNKDFDALVNDLVKALDKNNVAKDDKDELLKMLGTMRKDVVEKED
jgi:hemoglobin